MGNSDGTFLKVWKMSAHDWFQLIAGFLIGLAIGNGIAVCLYERRT